MFAVFISLMHMLQSYLLVSVAAQARKDWFFIALPNAMGVAFNAASLLLCVILPARERQANDNSTREPSFLKCLLQSFKGSAACSTQVDPESVESPATQPAADLTYVEAAGPQHPHEK